MVKARIDRGNKGKPDKGRAHMSTPEDNATASPAAASQVTERIQCLISPRRGRLARLMGINALRSGALESLVSDLKSEAGCEIVREMKPRRAARSQALDGEATSVYVARMALETFLELRARAAATRPEACIELDGELDYNWGWAANPASLQAALVERLRVDRMRRALSAPRGSRSQQIRLRVLGENQAPVANAHVRLEAVAAPQEGLTDGNGELTLTLHVSAGSGARSLFVDPPGDYWTRYLRYPGLNPEIDNVIVLRSLDKNLRDSGNGARYGWGQRWMGIDQLPAQMTGRGAKIAIIDSGADNQHPLLKHITNGVDLTSGHRWVDELPKTYDVGGVLARNIL